MPAFRVMMFTVLAMLAFAGNSLLCRLALKNTAIDAASFTSVRLVAAAITLWVLVSIFARSKALAGNWPSALALFIYAAGFSFAYINLTAATGALLLFGSVQISMIGFGIWKGERFSGLQVVGFLTAIAGLISLVLPGLSAPPLTNAILMIAAGVAWGAYSLRGRGAGDPTAVTAGNFIRTIPFTLVLSVVMFKHMNLDNQGVYFALASGAITSGLGYSIWYWALPGLKVTQAATVQLSVPVIAAFGGVLILGESLSLRLMVASVAIITGIACVIYEKYKASVV